MIQLKNIQFTDTHAHYFFIISYNTHLHILHLTQQTMQPVCTLIFFQLYSTLLSTLQIYRKGNVCSDMFGEKAHNICGCVSMCVYVSLKAASTMTHKHSCTIDTLSHTQTTFPMFVFHDKTIQDLQRMKRAAKKTLKTLGQHPFWF